MKSKTANKILIIFLTVILSLALIYGIFLLTGRIVYNEMFSRREVLAKNPGLSDGFIPQGLTFDENTNTFFTAGYMKDGSASRIYSVNKDSGIVSTISLLSNSKDFTGHCGGLQFHKGSLYLANESDGVYKIDLNPEVFNMISNEDCQIVVDIGNPIKLVTHSSFIFSKGDYIYVGEFNNDKKYICHNEFNFNNVNHKAIVIKYADTDLSTPLEVFSIGNEIQGFAILPDDTIVLSKSYALASSQFIFYEKANQIPTGKTMYDAPVIFLDEPTKIIKAPPMSEDLDVIDDKIIYFTESASKKYIFGNLYFDKYIYAF